MRIASVTALTCLLAVPAMAQETDNPFPDPIEAEDGVVVVDVVEHAELPDVHGMPAQMRTLRHEPGTDRIFVSNQVGRIYDVDDDGTVTEYLDVDAEEWGVDINRSWREVGVQSFALHPQFAEEGAEGYGKLYVWVDTNNTDPQPDAQTSGDVAHHTVLLEFTASDASAARYDGDAPREVARFTQPYANHNGGDLAFNPLAGPDDADYGMLYMGVGDGGSGGDPLEVGQDRVSAHGKILRIDPLGSNGLNGEYGVPSDNPFVGRSDAVQEIFAYGLRNPQQFAWDSETGQMFVSDIGQNTVEEVSAVSAGDNLGWNIWEGSFRYVGRTGVDANEYQSDADMVYPVAEYDQVDPLLGDGAAVTGLVVARDTNIDALNGRILFGDLPRGEIFHFSADDLPDGGQDALRRVLLDAGNGEQRLLDLVRDKREEQGRESADRVDLRIAEADGEIYILNKYDGVIRRLVP
ncbi:MAG: PQQ-dependent sugar dehydrogenase [Pseudohongiellaceae bacterium]